MINASLLHDGRRLTMRDEVGMKIEAEHSKKASTRKQAKSRLSFHFHEERSTVLLVGRVMSAS